MPLGRWFGVAVRLSWSLFALLAVAAGLGFWGHALVVLLSLCTHELAHLIAARAMDVPVERVDLLPFGGVARLEGGGELDPHAETLVAVAGPLNNFLLVAGGLLLHRSGLAEPELLPFFLETNLGLACFNLLPALPLDGGRIYRALLARRWGYRRTTRHLARVGRLLAALLFAAGAAGAYWGRVYLGLAVAAVLLYLTAREAESEVGYAIWLGLMRKKQVLRRQGALPVQTLVVAADVRLGDLSRHFWARRFHRFQVAGERWEVIGQFDERELAEALLALGLDASAAAAVRHLRARGELDRPPAERE